MQVGIILAMRKAGSRRFSSGKTDSDSGMCERLPLAKMSPSAMSPASATMRLRKAASTMGGKPPSASYERNRATKSRISASGLPATTPMRRWLGACATPMPKRNRPPDISWT